MPIIRATLFFESEGYGWTETYAREGPALADFGYLTITDALAQKRAKLNGAETYIRYLRWSQDDVFRDSMGHTYSGSGLRGLSTEPSAAPQLALMARFRNAAGTRYKLAYLRGIWDSVSATGGTYTPTVAFTGYWDDFRAKLLQDAWGWVGRNVTTKANVGTVAQLEAGTVAVTCATNLFPGPYPMKATVRVSGVQGATQLNGVHVVQASSATQFTTQNRIAIFPYLTGGVVTYNTETLQLIGQASPQRIVERKPGRPSYKSRGRRSARAAS